MQTYLEFSKIRLGAPKDLVLLVEVTSGDEAVREVSVTVTMRDPTRQVSVLSDLLSVPLPYKSTMVLLGDLGPAEHRQVLLRLGGPEPAAPGPVKVADITLSYVDAVSPSRTTEVIPISVHVVSDEAAAEPRRDGRASS